jgi:hypothetical protein
MLFGARFITVSPNKSFDTAARGAGGTSVVKSGLPLYANVPAEVGVAALNFRATLIESLPMLAVKVAGCGADTRDTLAVN